MSPRYFDIHAHLDYPDYDSDREEIISAALKSGILVNTVGTDPDGNRKAVALANNDDHIYATVGFHPNDLEAITESDWQELEKLITSEKKVVAVGECGLDYFRLAAGSEKTKEQQKVSFFRQVELASRFGKALMVHTRPAKGTLDAYEDTATFFEKEVRPNYPDLKINLHCFSGDWTLAKKFLDLGCFLSFTGVVTFARDYDEVVKNTPMSRLMAETDAPFLSPAPFRGQRNDPSRVTLVVQTLAQIRGENEENLSHSLLDNSRGYFDL